MIWDEQLSKYWALDSWFNSPQGLRVGQAFANEILSISHLIKGSKLLQMGACGENPWLKKLRYHHKWLATPSDSLSRVSIRTSLKTLPLARSSIDCVIAPLILESFGYDQNLMDEIDRVVKPMGYVIFFGVNPFSFWGAALKLGRIHCFGETKGHLISSLSLKNAMISRGYSQCVLNSFYFIPPVTSQTSIKRLEFLNEMGKMMWPYPAGFYFLVMQKYQPASPSLIFNRIDNALLQLARN